MLASGLRGLRRRILTPNVSATRLETRGFHVKNAASQELLETVGRTFLTGYGYAVEAHAPTDAEERLEQIPVQFRGFAYEGAAMGACMLDGMPGTGGRRFTGMMTGRAAQHVYMAYIGVGWAMARLPKFRWSRLQAPDPLLRWLVLDGYGFHQAYFHTAKYVHGQFTDPAFGWPADGPSWYASRVIDQGIGRAMWFVGGTDPALVASMIGKFPRARQADMFSGAGLAATYAGGVDEAELRLFWDRAGDFRPEVAQGSAFAATARVHAGLVVPHTQLATQVFCGMTAEQATKICENTLPAQVLAGPLEPGEPPAFEVWRQHIAAEVMSLGGARS
jgi:enediyne biosynthesis protein E3